MTLQDDFAEAQKRVKTLPSTPDTGTLLELYALYKQGTVGDTQGKRPGVLDIKGRAKYDAWAKLTGTDREQAMTRYIALVESLFAK